MQQLEAQFSIDAANSVVVAMSGGVDSSAAALLLHEQGKRVIGVSMQVWDYSKGGSRSRATCCSPKDFDDARSVAAKAGFPFYVVDFENTFSQRVIEPFVDSYLSGETPNPCLSCNRHVKFAELRARAELYGASVIATGHYAEIRRLKDGERALYSAVDRSKDQSYFLYAMTQRDLERTSFPLGRLEKSEVRSYLASRGVRTSEKPESQDICFVSSSVKEFVEEFVQLRKKERKQVSGPILSAEGEVLGQHDGIHQFTVGQRRGLGISSPKPVYVTRIDAEKNAVYVGERAQLERKSFCLKDVSWTGKEAAATPFEALVKLRYRHPGVVCRVTPTSPDSAEVEFTDQWTEVTPGQAAVFYSLEEDFGQRRVYGGGTMVKDY